jgi:hypothetical protein
LFFGGPVKETPDGRKSLAQGDPGTDCPNGISKVDGLADLISMPWRSEKEVQALLTGNGGQPVTGEPMAMALAQRGYKPGINTFYSPYAAADPGQIEVSGTTAEGFDLDNNPNTGGFTSPDGRPGIDNALYRAVGCLYTWRGGIAAGGYTAGFADDVRRTGKWVNTVIRISGSKDPMNDDDATLEIGWSPDSGVSDAGGTLASGYSFRIAYGPRYTKMKAKIVNGVIETEVTPELRTSSLAAELPATGEMIFYQGRMKFTITPEGNLRGMVGGYVKWTQPYMDTNFTFGPGTKETNFRYNQMGEYYAIRRNADAMPDPVTGRYTALSAAFNVDAVPAFVIEPKTEIVAPAHLFPDRLRFRQLFLVASSSSTPLAVNVADLIDPGNQAVDQRARLAADSAKPKN